MAFQYKQYLVVTRWVFDFSNYEYCTLTLEGSESDDISKMFAGDNNNSIGVYNRLIKRVCDAQNGNLMDTHNCKPVALYRVVGPNKPYENVGLPECEGGIKDMKSLKFELELIGHFDQDGKPIPAPQVVPA